MSGTSGGFSKSSSSSESRDRTPAEFQALRGPVADLFRSSFGDISSFLGGDLGFGGVSGSDLDLYRAPITGGEREQLGRLTGLSGGSRNEGLSEDLLGSTLRGDFLRPGSNPALGDVLRYTMQAINDAYNSQGLESSALFSRAGHRLDESSPFAQAQADLSKSRLDAIGRSTSEILFSGYEAERSRQLQAVEQQRANAAFEFDRQTKVFEASALPRLIDELGYERAFTEFSARLNALSQALGLATTSALPTPVSVGKSKSLAVNQSIG
jgi:hypothetical protein